MCSMSVLCPLCAQTSFSSIDALRCSLIKAANGPLACPICHELFLGLDKLTIHLFSHTNIMNANDGNRNLTKMPPPNVVNNINTSNNYINSNYINQKLKTEDVLNGQKCLEEANLESTHHQTHHLLDNNLTSASGQRAFTKENKITKIQKPPPISTNAGDTPPSLAAVCAEDVVPLATCDICEFTFRNEELRDMHVRLVHRNMDFQKNLVESSNKLLPANVDLDNQNAEPHFKCHLCSKTFKMKGSLWVHLKVVHLMGLPYINNTPKLSICDRIRHKESKQMKASNVQNADTHTSDGYKLNPISLIPALLNAGNSSHNFGNLNVLSIKSGAEFLPDTLNPNVVYVLNNSDQQVGMKSNQECDENLSTSKANNLCSTADNSKTWECDVCSKAFTTKYFLKKHKRLHTGEMPYTCEICARTFTFQQSYHKHLLYHSDEKPHVCSTCGRAFKELSTLHNHERIHSGEKPFKCEVCGKSFRQRVSFLVHTRIHTGVMPYKCETCQKSFRYKVSQRTHKCQATVSNEENGKQTEYTSTIATGTSNSTTMDGISEHFIKAFLESSTKASQLQNLSTHSAPLCSLTGNDISSTNVTPPVPTTSNSPPSVLNEHQALLTKTIDDIVVESCNKLGIGNNGSVADFTPIENTNEGSMSPSQKLQNMRLYSPQMVTPVTNVTEGDDTLSRFFLDNSNGGQNIL